LCDDWCVSSTPLGLEDVSRYPYLLAELLGSGRWTENDLQKLVGKNLIRVFRKVEEVSFFFLTSAFSTGPQSPSFHFYECLDSLPLLSMLHFYSS
jgi:hypothetical protein